MNNPCSRHRYYFSLDIPNKLPKEIRDECRKDPTVSKTETLTSLKNTLEEAIAGASVQFHYRTFLPTTGCSAPVPRIGTLIPQRL